MNIPGDSDTSKEDDKPNNKTGQQAAAGSVAVAGDAARGSSAASAVSSSILRRLLGILGLTWAAQETAEKYAYVKHYTTAANAALIEADGVINPSQNGFTYLTGDSYTDGATAQDRLAMRVRPEGYLMVPIRNITPGASMPTPVVGNEYGRGGGMEISYPGPVSSARTRWVPFE